MTELGNKEFAYGHEELVAEIGACFLYTHAGITGRFEQSTAYINNWLTVLKKNKYLLFAAASAAQKAADFILNIQHEEPEAVSEDDKA